MFCFCLATLHLNSVPFKESSHSVLFLDILAGGKGAISQIVAAHVVRCRIPGPCVVGVTLLEANEVKKSSPASQHQAVNSEILQGID